MDGAERRVLHDEFIGGFGRGIGRFCAIPNRTVTQVFAVPQDIVKLVMNIPPLAHTGITQKMIPTPTPHLRLRKLFEFVVQRLPD